MLLGFIYLYKFVISYLFQKAEYNRLKKSESLKIFNFVFLFLHKIVSVGPIDQQTNLTSSNVLLIKLKLLLIHV